MVVSEYYLIKNQRTDRLYKENGYHSISFPLISSSIFGGNLENSVAESTKQCLWAYKKFTSDFPDYDIDVILCAFTPSEMNNATREYEGFEL